MKLLRKQRNNLNFDERNFAIKYLKSLATKDYEKFIKIVEIYRKADEDAKVVELGSKKAVREQEKEELTDAAVDAISSELEEIANE